MWQCNKDRQLITIMRVRGILNPLLRPHVSLAAAPPVTTRCGFVFLKVVWASFVLVARADVAAAFVTKHGGSSEAPHAQCTVPCPFDKGRVVLLPQGLRGCTPQIQH